MPDTIAVIKDELAELNELVEATNTRMERAEDPFPWELSLQSLDERRNYLLEDLERQLQAAQIAELFLECEGGPVAGEAIDVRFLSELLGRVQDLVSALGQAIASQPTRRGSIPSDITSRTRLRLAATIGGSFAARLVGSVQPDLFGESLIEDCFGSLHELLAVGDNADSLAEILSRLGSRSQSHYDRFLSVVSENDVDIKLSTRTREGQRREATVRPDPARNVRQALELLEREAQRTETYRGRLMGLRQHRRDFEFLEEHTERIITGPVLEEAMANAVCSYDQTVTAEFIVETLSVRGREFEQESFTLRAISSDAPEEP